MAIDIQSIDYLVNSIVPEFSNWTPDKTSSVLSNQAIIPKDGYVSYELSEGYNSGKSQAAYRKLVLEIKGSNIGTDILSNYISEGRLQFEYKALYSINTSSEEMYESILCIINNKDIVSQTEDIIIINKIIPTWNKALQTGIVRIINKSEATLTLYNVALYRSADVSNEQAKQILNDILKSTDPEMFKWYRVNNILNGLGIVTASGREIKFKPIRKGNDVVEIQTNYRAAIPNIYLNEEIDLSTDQNDTVVGSE